MALHVYPAAKPIFSLTAPLPSTHPGAPVKHSDAPFYSTFPHVQRGGALTPLALG